MTLMLKPETEKKFHSFATRQGLEPEEALELLLGHDSDTQSMAEHFSTPEDIEAIREGLEQAKRGEGIEMEEFFVQMDADKEQRRTNVLAKTSNTPSTLCTAE